MNSVKLPVVTGLEKDCFMQNQIHLNHLDHSLVKMCMTVGSPAVRQFLNIRESMPRHCDDFNTYEDNLFNSNDPGDAVVTYLSLPYLINGTQLMTAYMFVRQMVDNPLMIEYGVNYSIEKLADQLYEMWESSHVAISINELKDMEDATRDALNDNWDWVERGVLHG